jgi:hypothetical protein
MQLNLYLTAPTQGTSVVKKPPSLLLFLPRRSQRLALSEPFDTTNRRINHSA